MVDVRIEKKPAFSVIGRKTYISGPAPDQFGAFWKTAHESGLIGLLNDIHHQYGCPITNGTQIGLSCTEKNPANRDFDFFICVEYPPEKSHSENLEVYDVASFTWAVFSRDSCEISALIECEKYAFTTWLPASEYRHAFGPEMEVYHQTEKIEFWLPIVSK